MLLGASCLYSCAPTGYVSTPPADVQISRPPQPTTVHIWRDADWRWNNQARGYTYGRGNWVKPYRGRTFVSGHWQKHPRGHYWVNGRWR